MDRLTVPSLTNNIQSILHHPLDMRNMVTKQEALIGHIYAAIYTAVPTH
jgi:hypothetical protein